MHEKCKEEVWKFHGMFQNCLHFIVKKGGEDDGNIFASLEISVFIRQFTKCY